MKKRKVSLQDLIQKNKEELIRDKDELEKIEKRIADKRQMRKS